MLRPHDKPGVWAVGDITAGHALAHRAFEQGIITAETIAGLNPKPLDEDTIPQIVFSNPEARRVGLTATGAKSATTSPISRRPSIR